MCLLNSISKINETPRPAANPGRKENEMAKIKQLFCRHRYADKNLDIVEINHYTDIVRLRNYCVKCGKPYEVSLSYRCMFGKVEEKMKGETPCNTQKAN